MKVIFVSIIWAENHYSFKTKIGPMKAIKMPFFIICVPRLFITHNKRIQHQLEKSMPKMKHLELTPQKKQLKQLLFPLLTIEVSIRLKGMSHHVIKSALLTLRKKVWLFTNCYNALQKSFHCGLNLGFYQVLIIYRIWP